MAAHENWTLRHCGDAVKFGLNDEIGANLSAMFGASIARDRIKYKLELDSDRFIKRSAIEIDGAEVVNQIYTVFVSENGETWLECGAIGSGFFNLSTGARESLENYRELA